MSYCEKCGSYVPIDETACPACGFDPAQQGYESGRYNTQTQGQSASQSQYASQSAYASQGTYQASSGWDSAGEREPWKRPQERDPWESGSGAGKQKKAGGTGQGARRAQQKAYVYAGDDAGDYRGISILSYFGILFLIPLFMHRESAFVRFHANQGLLLFLAELVVQFTTRYFPVLGGLIGTVGGIFCLVCFFKGIGSASKGRMDKLPVIGEITLIR